MVSNTTRKAFGRYVIELNEVDKQNVRVYILCYKSSIE